MNGADAPLPACEGFVALLAARARAEPDGIYARFAGAPLTFGDLDRRSASLAAHLHRRGLAPGARVAVMMRNSVAAVATIFALARAGLVWTPVNAQQRGEGLRYQLDHARPVLVIVDADLAPRIAEAAGDAAPELLLHAEGGALEAALEAGAPFDAPEPAPDAPLAIMYTSGTTGRPKGVIVTHRMLRLAAEGVLRVSAARAGDTLFVWEPLYHVGGAQLLPLPLFAGLTLAMVDRFSASRFWEEARAAGASHIHYLGGILQILLKQPPAPLDRAHGVRIAWGGGCPPDVWAPFRDRFGVEIRECYGMTEASSITTCNTTGVVGSVGRALPWFGVQLLDEAGVEVATGARGEITVETSLPGAIFPGYLDNPEATAQALRGGRLHTGDIGSFDVDGNLFFHGRRSDSVRRRGENVSALEVELVAARHEAVEDCAMIGVEAEIGEQEIKLFVKPRAGRAIDPAALSAWLAERLAPYQTPRYIAIVAEFERTASQRIMKHRLSTRRDDCWDAAAPGDQ